MFTATTATVIVALAGINQTTNAAVRLANPTLAIQNNSLKNKVAVYPNPVTENLFFAGDYSNFEVVKVINMEGRVVSSQSIIDGKVDLNKLPAGNYILQLSGKNQKDQTIQIIKK